MSFETIKQLHMMIHLTEILILIMLGIVFLQSGIDKVVDRKGNLEWLRSHFSASVFKNIVDLNFNIITVLEIASGVLAIVGAVVLVLTGDTLVPLIAAISSAITFLCLFLGQRIAKDYPGAQTIVIYLIPTFFLVYLLTMN